ncbi:MAG: hypothetical protein JSW11_22660 [Candidatus Heimdallarchaeota archaeon]|nr:MAG: hypothetical protein JSW11_22660 [Candidatus Heimdallarchaeota archaeon]
MTKLFAKLKAISLIILLLVVISCGVNRSVSPVAVKSSPTRSSANGELLVIDELNLKAKVNKKFVPLEELIPEVVSPEFQDNPLPQLLNNTIIHVNASYSTIIGRSERIAIHQFTVDIYSVISGEKHELNHTEALSRYYDINDPNLDIIEFVLDPNSSKSEDVVFPLKLMTYGVYKFVFQVQYHIEGLDLAPKNAYYSRNITFELVKSYPIPPYIIVYAFFAVVVIFITLILFGLYGDRKYKQPTQ